MNERLRTAKAGVKAGVIRHQARIRMEQIQKSRAAESVRLVSAFA